MSLKFRFHYSIAIVTLLVIIRRRPGCQWYKLLKITSLFPWSRRIIETSLDQQNFASEFSIFKK